MYLSQWFTPVTGSGKNYTFIFDKQYPGITTMRSSPGSVATKLGLLRPGVKVDIDDIRVAFDCHLMPPVVTPKGFTLKRSEYLYDKV